MALPEREDAYGEDAPGLDTAIEVETEVAVQRRSHVVRRHGRGDADRGGLVALAGVERPRQLALLEEHVSALVEAPREHERVQDPQQRIPVEPESSSLLQPAPGLRGAHARNRHALSVSTALDSGATSRARPRALRLG